MALPETDASRLLAAKYVRVTRRRGNGLVEFDFAIGRPEIFAELLMPQDAFDEFCRANAVIDMTGRPVAVDEYGARLSRVLTGREE